MVLQEEAEEAADDETVAGGEASSSENQGDDEEMVREEEETHGHPAFTDAFARAISDKARVVRQRREERGGLGVGAEAL